MGQRRHYTYTKVFTGSKIKVTVASLAISLPDTFAMKSVLTEGCMYTQGKVLRHLIGRGQYKMIDQEEDKDLEDCPFTKV